MTRPPNFNTSQWFHRDRDGDTWKGQARCPEHLDLPWTVDKKPDDNALIDMAMVCAECPVVLRCAEYALGTNNGRGVEGGFYAGMWIPWEASERGQGYLRVRARRALRAAMAQIAPR